MLANAVELTDWDGDYLQVVLCEGCGFEGCKFGGYAVLRRLNDLILIIPDFDLIDKTCDDPDLRDQYLPPSYMTDFGLMAVEHDGQVNLRKLVDDLPPTEGLPFINTYELARLWQWRESDYKQLLAYAPEAPAVARKTELPPDRALRLVAGSLSKGLLKSTVEDVSKLCTTVKDLVIASDFDELDRTEAINMISNLANCLLSTDLNVRLRPTTSEDQVITLFLDLDGTPEWPALAFDRRSFHLLVAPDIALIQART